MMIQMMMTDDNHSQATSQIFSQKKNKKANFQHISNDIQRFIQSYKQISQLLLVKYDHEPLAIMFIQQYQQFDYTLGQIIDDVIKNSCKILVQYSSKHLQHIFAQILISCYTNEQYELIDVKKFINFFIDILAIKKHKKQVSSICYFIDQIQHYYSQHIQQAYDFYQIYMLPMLLKWKNKRDVVYAIELLKELKDKIMTQQQSQADQFDDDDDVDALNNLDDEVHDQLHAIEHVIGTLQAKIKNNKKRSMSIGANTVTNSPNNGKKQATPEKVNQNPADLDLDLDLEVDW